MTVFFTSDTHFGDRRVLQIDRRPFSSVAAHDEGLVAFWNETVGEDDEVWHLGDFAVGTSAGRIQELLAALNGRKHLVIGNNDKPATIESPGWASRQHYAELVVDERRLVLAHYAFRTWNGIGRGALDLHGHSHGRLRPQARQYDVGVDAWDFRPVTLDTILARRRPAPGIPPKRSGGPTVARNERYDLREVFMRKLLVLSAVAALVPLLGVPAAVATPAATAAARVGGALQHDLVQPAKGRGHAYGHRKHGNRGLHRGWSIGRGNPHR